MQLIEQTTHRPTWHINFYKACFHDVYGHCAPSISITLLVLSLNDGSTAVYADTQAIIQPVIAGVKDHISQSQTPWVLYD